MLAISGEPCASCVVYFLGVNCSLRFLSKKRNSLFVLNSMISLLSPANCFFTNSVMEPTPSCFSYMSATGSLWGMKTNIGFNLEWMLHRWKCLNPRGFNSCYGDFLMFTASKQIYCPAYSEHVMPSFKKRVLPTNSAVKA